MSKSKIEWTDRVWNPVTGCTKVSQGCKHCYAERLAGRFWGERKFTDVQCHPERLEQPLHWRKPSRVFVNSMSDLFHEAVAGGFIEMVWGVMRKTPQHTYQILTKRPKRMQKIIKRLAETTGILPNVCLGVSVEDQQTADERSLYLKQTPAAVKFISCEPLLGPLKLWWVRGEEFTDSLGGVHHHAMSVYDWISWVIVGGESGTGARPLHPDWVRRVRDECQATRTPFFFKQWGEWLPVESPEATLSRSKYDKQLQWVRGRDECGYYCDEEHGHIDHSEWLMERVGKKNAGRELDGREWNEYPEG